MNIRSHIDYLFDNESISTRRRDSAEIGLPFLYDDSDAAFTSDVCIYHRYAAAER